MGFNPVYAESARELGLLFAQRSITLIYGGGNVGLMGVVADSVMSAGGKVIGIIPAFLEEREVGHRGITQLEVVESMHQRKKRMADLADAFIALPGGWGTLEELAEILTWRQLSLLQSPIGILNVNHFYDPLLGQMDRMCKEGFLKESYLKLLHTANSPQKLLSILTSLSH
jgi:uncharacterized protein (TIGR00730 family)